VRKLVRPVLQAHPVSHCLHASCTEQEDDMQHIDIDEFLMGLSAVAVAMSLVYWLFFGV